jgi:hypothetical protein
MLTSSSSLVLGRVELVVTRKAAPATWGAGVVGVPAGAGLAGAGAGGVATAAVEAAACRPVPISFLVMTNPWSLNEKQLRQLWLLTRCRGHLKFEKSALTLARLRGPDVTSTGSLLGVAPPACLALSCLLWSVSLCRLTFLSIVSSNVFASAVVSRRLVSERVTRPKK